MSPRTRHFTWAATAALLLTATAGAQAESLKCQGAILGEGDSKLVVLKACGEPLLKDTFCKPITVVAPGYPGTTTIYNAWPCQPVDEWFYDRGPGNLAAIVRFEQGLVHSIRYGQSGRRN